MMDKFLEQQFSHDFCADLTQSVKGLVEGSVDFTLVALPGLGATTYLKFLTGQSFAKFIYLNLTNITSLNNLTLIKSLAEKLGAGSEDQIKQKLAQLVKNDQKVVIILGHFDQLQPSNELFVILDNLRKVDPKNIVLIFHTNKPLIQTLPPQISSTHLSLISKTLFLKPYSEKELEQILKVIALDPSLEENYIKKAVKLSGGHCLLLRLLLKTPFQEQPLDDPSIVLELKNILQNFSYQDRKAIEKIAAQKGIANLNPQLLGYGIVYTTPAGHQLFSPLLQEYIKSQLPLKLAPNEAKLLKLLKENLGKVVTKDKIFSFVWEDNLDASDWALNSIIYRLRKKQDLINQGYQIESYKKIGYCLTKH